MRPFWSVDHGALRSCPACKRGRPKEDGFTLLELLVVLGILALVAALVGPPVLRYLGKSRTETAKVQVSYLVNAVELYALDTGGYPTPNAGLKALLDRPDGVSGWAGPYLKKAGGLVDPWGKPYAYRSPGTSTAFDVYSFGRDAAEGGSGENEDVKSW